MSGNSNSGARALPTTRRSATSKGEPVCPDWLGGVGKQKFEELTPLLVEEYGAGQIDSDTLARYCHAFEEFYELKDCPMSTTTEKGNTVQHPLLSIRNKALDRMHRLAPHLGLTIHSRAKLPLSEDDFGGEPGGKWFAQTMAARLERDGETREEHIARCNARTAETLKRYKTVG